MARLNIVNGPSKFEVILSLFDGNAQNRRPVNLVLMTEKTGIFGRDFFFDSVEREDGSGECWNFSGLYKPELQSDRLVRAHGFYSTQTRKGFLEVEG